MYLKQFIFVNWGNLPNQVFDFGPLNLLSGGNGSGKTTAADAIQTLMTAAHDNLYSYNPGQDESNQRSRGKTVRTLASYVLGCDDGSYSRPQRTDGYLAANFQPSKGEDSEPFAVVFHVRAHLEVSGSKRVARQDSIQFFIIRASQVNLSDFVNHQKVTDGSQILSHLTQRYPAHLVERYNRKKSYLARLYGALRGRDDSVNEREAMHCAKTFARFMAYKPVRSINEFVAAEVLEKRDLGEAIRNISSLMKTIHGMEASAKLIRDGVDLLDSASRQSKSFISDWLKANQLLLAEASARYKNDQKAYVNAKHKQQELRSEIKNNVIKREKLSEQVAATRSQLIQVEAQRQGNVSQVSLERDLELAQKVYSDGLANVLSDLKCWVKNNVLAQSMSELILASGLDESLKSTLETCQSIGETSSSLGDVSKLDLTVLKQTESVIEDISKVCGLHRKLRHGLRVEEEGRELIEFLFAKKAEFSRCHTIASNDVASIKQEILGLNRAQSSYPSQVARALTILRQSLPEADARILCDYISIDDPRWQSAIEGYMGAARFNIIVDDAFEAEAADILRKHSDIGRSVRVVQTKRAAEDAKRIQVQHESIINIMSFDHHGAAAFVKASFANVIRVDTSAQLSTIRRGLTASGIGAAGYALFKCGLADGDLVFGQGARERNLLAKQEKLANLLQTVGELSKKLQSIGDLIRSIEQIKVIHLDRSIAELTEAKSHLVKLEEQQSSLGKEEHSDLEIKLNDLMNCESSLNESLSELMMQFGSKQSELERVDRKIGRLDSEQQHAETQLDTAEHNLKRAASFWLEFDVETAISVSEDMAMSLKLDDIVAQASEAKDFLGAYVNELERLVVKFNEINTTSDAIVFMPPTRALNSELFEFIVATHESIDKQYNRLKNNVLAQKYEQLQHYKASFDNTFVTHLCHAVYQAVSEGERTLQGLNVELQHHSFGADKERYSFDWEWDLEFKEYWDFFAEVTKSPKIGNDDNQNSLFNEAIASKFSRVRDRLMAMLLDEDDQKAMKALEDITDYRRYRRYEIYKTPEGKQPIPLSEYGTGSGGQLETPAYIIRAAAITSAFKFSESGSHLRMVLVDEAFSKMDEHRSREVIQYLTERLGLQLGFVMPTSKSGPFLDIISNQFVFAKVPLSYRRGELETGVLVDRQVLNQDSVARLWESHRQYLKSQSEMAFLADL